MTTEPPPSPERRDVYVEIETEQLRRRREKREKRIAQRKRIAETVIGVLGRVAKIFLP